jgi:hypothetical protein
VPIDPLRDPQTPREMREAARRMRAEARALVRRAEELEFEEKLRAQREASREAAEERAASHCRPVWSPSHERAGGPWVVLGIEAGQILVGAPPRPGRAAEAVAAYSTGTGWSRGSWREEAIRMGRLDVRATIAAWRAWCAARREARSSEVGP